MIKVSGGQASNGTQVEGGEKEMRNVLGWSRNSLLMKSDLTWLGIEEWAIFKVGRISNMLGKLGKTSYFLTDYTYHFFAIALYYTFLRIQLTVCDLIPYIYCTSKMYLLRKPRY